MIEGVERLTALVLLVTALSHIAAPGAWNDLFTRIRRHGDLAGFANAAIHLPLGLIIVAFHQVWTWPEAVVTVIGWSLTLKGTVHLIFPQLTQLTLALPGEGAVAERRYRLFGIAALPLAMFVGWIAFR